MFYSPFERQVAAKLAVFNNPDVTAGFSPRKSNACGCIFLFIDSPKGDVGIYL
jgi:hypothetical protein